MVVGVLSFGWQVKKVCLTPHEIAQILPNYSPKYEKIKVCYPQLKGEKENFQLNQKIRNLVLKDLRNVMDLDLEGPHPTITSQFPATYDATFGLKIFNNRLLSLFYYVYNFTGGAHGNDYYIVANWDLKTQKKLKFGDIFEREKLPQLKRLILSIDQKNGKKIEWVEDFLNPQFVPAVIFEPGKAVFLFSRYEVSPGYMGSFGIEVPFTKLKTYLTPTYRKVLLGK
jgi:hypothetical protein